MSLKVVIPAPLRKHTAGAEIVEVDAGNVQEVIDRLEARFPGIRDSVCDDPAACAASSIFTWMAKTCGSWRISRRRPATAWKSPSFRQSPAVLSPGEG